MSSIAIIPARGGSKRLPRKNVLTFMGKPMISYPISTARECGLFSQVIVSTENQEIADIAHAENVTVIQRPMDLASDSATVVEVCCHVLQVLDKKGLHPEYLCCIYATAVFITADDLIKSYNLLESSHEVDFVMGVSSYPIHPYRALIEQDGYLRLVWPEKKAKSQALPKMVASNGTLYWARTDAFLLAESFYGNFLVGYEIPRERAIDIDTQDDLAWAKLVAQITWR